MSFRGHQQHDPMPISGEIQPGGTVKITMAGVERTYMAQQVDLTIDPITVPMVGDWRQSMRPGRETLQITLVEVAPTLDLPKPPKPKPAAAPATAAPTSPPARGRAPRPERGRR